jgi:KaiC/GvpD/RAD55 family RecA-like ATPase
MLFISYAHGDGADLAQRLQSDLESTGHDVWLDRSRLAVGASWSADIEHAIDRCDVVLALLSPGSFASDICRGELLRALRRRKRVIILTLTEDVDRPLFLETKLYLSFALSRGYAEAFAELVAEIAGAKTAQLATGYQDTYVTAPRLPATIVLRPGDLRSLREGVLRDKAPATMSVASVVGMGGLGKTTLAQMLCHDRVVQDAYPDGIIWVQLGQQAADLVPKMREVGRALGDEPKHYDTVDGARNRLRTILRKKAVLIVLDDVWELTQAEAFLADAPGSCLLITTRMHEISLSLRARRIAIDSLSHAQSLEILAQWTELPVAQLPPQAAEIVRKCGRLPLALAMVGGLVHGGLLNGRADAWTAALYRLNNAQLDYIRFPLEHYPYPELQLAIQVSVDALEPRFRGRYLTMGVFPEDVPVPESTLCTLWDVDEYEMQSTVDSWLTTSLATRDDQGRIALHDLQLDYVRKVTPHGLAALHQQVVRQYAAACGSVWSKGPNDGYFFQRIAWHMAGAEKWQELATMLLDGAYIPAKLDVLSHLELSQDFHWSASCLAALKDAAEQNLFSELGGAVRRLSGFVNRKVETATVERWIEEDKGPCLLIQGAAGSGKTSLMHHLWVRNPRNSILVSFSFARNHVDSSNIFSDILAQISFRAFPLANVTSNRSVWELRHALERSRAKYYVFVDGVDEIEPVTRDTEREFLHALGELTGTLRFVFAGRASQLFQNIAAQFPRTQILMLGDLPRVDLIKLVNNMLRGGGVNVDERSLEAIVERSEGNPFIVSLLADALKEGATLEGLLQPVNEQYVSKRVIGRLVAGGVPDEMLRVLTSLLLKKQDIVWEELQRELNASDSNMQALQSTAIFVLEPAGERHILRVHDLVLEGLRLHYKLTDDTAQH